jgi:hypothetical protein
MQSVAENGYRRYVRERFISGRSAFSLPYPKEGAGRAKLAQLPLQSMDKRTCCRIVLGANRDVFVWTLT